MRIFALKVFFLLLGCFFIYALLAKSTPTGKKVSLDTLQSKLTLIESASSGILSGSTVCADAGTYRYSAFAYESP